MILLDALPWPWGEDILAGLFAVIAFARPSRQRRAITWALQHSSRRTWSLAWAACAFRGRWVARSALVGVRRPDDLRQRIEIRGEEHLAPTSTGTILLGFHVGPPVADVALRVQGHRLAWLGGRRVSRAWRRATWRPLLDQAETLSPSGSVRFWAGSLYRARRILLDGGTVFMMADGWGLRGRPALRVTVTGGAVVIMPGWLTLWRQTGARVLPVLTHLAGRTQVVAVHPPLERDGGGEDAWPERLSSIVRAYVDRFPEQCPNLLFPPAVDPQ